MLQFGSTHCHGTLLAPGTAIYIVWNKVTVDVKTCLGNTCSPYCQFQKTSFSSSSMRMPWDSVLWLKLNSEPLASRFFKTWFSMMMNWCTLPRTPCAAASASMSSPSLQLGKSARWYAPTRSIQGVLCGDALPTHFLQKWLSHKLFGLGEVFTFSNKKLILNLSLLKVHTWFLWLCGSHFFFDSKRGPHRAQKKVAWAGPWRSVPAAPCVTQIYWTWRG